jgi:ubiquinone/menaquinone biosynthesis C-methylase UbiE/uncharacterized protein YbaR (Trm112 family)
MKKGFLDILRCPDCKGTLSVTDDKIDGDEIVAGKLVCQGCQGTFPISEMGVPQMLPAALQSETPQDEDFQRKKIEMATRDEQVTVYDKLPLLLAFGRIEIPLSIKYAQLRPTDTLLEGGCGNGRMTQEFARCVKRLVALDFSLASIHMNLERLKSAGVTNVDLVQGDLSHLPMATDAFDRVVSCQVIEHLPSHDSRAKAIKEFSRVSKTGSKVVVTGYKYNLYERIFGTKQGEHPGKIPFFRFTKKEFKDLMEEGLKVEAIDGRLIYTWVARSQNAK